MWEVWEGTLKDLRVIKRSGGDSLGVGYLLSWRTRFLTMRSLWEASVHSITSNSFTSNSPRRPKAQTDCFRGTIVDTTAGDDNTRKGGRSNITSSSSSSTTTTTTTTTTTPDCNRADKFSNSSSSLWSWSALAPLSMRSTNDATSSNMSTPTPRTVPPSNSTESESTPLPITWREMGNWLGATSSGSATWQVVMKQLDPSLRLIEESDAEKIQQLVNGIGWMDNVSSSFRQIYGSFYDEYRSKRHCGLVDGVPSEYAYKIQKDINRTYGLFCRSSQLASFVFGLKRGAYLKSLNHLLLAASKKYGYTQGMNFVAANFLLHYSERESFILFCFLMEERHLNILFNPKTACLVEYIKVFEKRLKMHYRKLYDHLKEIGFVGFCYAIEWFTTCFLVSNPGEVSACVFDMLMIDVKDTLIRVGLSVLANLESQLLSYDLEQMQVRSAMHLANLHTCI